MKTTDPEITFEPIGRKIRIEKTINLLEAARTAGIELTAFCGGKGTCGKCIVQLIHGELNPPEEAEIDSLGTEAVNHGYRLACRAYPGSDCRVYIPLNTLGTSQRLQLEGLSGETILDTDISSREIVLSPPTMDDLRSDEIRIKDAIKPNHLSTSLLRTFSDQLREKDWRVRGIFRGKETIALLNPRDRYYGLAVDCGTTSLAAYLLELSEGRVVGKLGLMNPQIAYGEDVVTRITYALQNKGGRQILQKALVEAINSIIQSFCEQEGIYREQIVDMTFVGNTAMHHLFHGLPVRQLGLAPYVPAVNGPLDIKALEVGIKVAPGAYIHTTGNIAGYVGSDHVSMLLAAGIFNKKGTVLAIDIGTNTEMTLKNGSHYLCCSCASGPAFEGAHIGEGMRAAPGAIEKVQINREILLKTIDNKRPVGICGSGILDVLAELLKNNIVNGMGKFIGASPYIKGEGKDKVFILSPASQNGHFRDIVVSRKDINEILLAKAAIKTGIDILLELSGLDYENLDEVIIAGAFGSYINVESAVRIKMLPPLSLNRFKQIGNAAGMGAREMLINRQKRSLAAKIAGKVNYTELTNKKDFSSIFGRAMIM